MDTYANISLKTVNPRDLVGNAEEEEVYQMSSQNEKPMKPPKKTTQVCVASSIPLHSRCKSMCHFLRAYMGFERVLSNLYFHKGAVKS